MPIENDRFEKGTLPIKDRILNLLNQNKGKGFEIYEIIGLCEQLEYKEGGKRIGLALVYGTNYRNALNDLLNEKKIRVSKIGGREYYGL